MKKTVKTAGLAVTAFALASVLAGCAGNSDSGKTYTYHTTTSNYQTWSPTDWKIANEGDVLSYTTSPLYNFIPNETKDGYIIEPLLASALPVDVTKDYAGNEKYGVPADAESGYAYKVSLIKNAKWDDGTPIDADTFGYSIKQYLNPDMRNYRAATIYESLALANGKDYYSGSVVYNPAWTEEGGFSEVEDSELWVSTTEKVPYLGGESFTAYNGEDYPEYWTAADGTDTWEQFTEIFGEDEYKALTPELKDIIVNFINNCGEDGNELYRQCCLLREEKANVTTFEDVGFVKNDNYTFTFVLSQQMTPFMFELNSQIYLINEKLYEENKHQVGSLTKSRYGTSVETSAAYGPYKLASYEPDKRLTLVKNDSWFGYHDKKYSNRYQTTGIDYQIISDPETVFSLFLQGELDDTSVPASKRAQYSTSEYGKTTPESYTYRFSLNMDRKSLTKENTNGEVHSILANENFRHAFSLALDRTRFVSLISPFSTPAFGLINRAYVADPDTGSLYRDSDEAVNMLLDFYGAKDEADLTGYDQDTARKYMQKAYDEEVAAGYLKPTDKIVIDLHAYAATEVWNLMNTFLQESMDAASKGTSLEGKITINQVIDQNYYYNIKNGIVDLALTSWGGDDFNPYGIAWCYCTEEALYDYGFKPEEFTLTINIDGEDITKTFYDWYIALCQKEYTAAPLSVKNHILASLEKGWISYYNMIPMYSLNSFGLYSQRVQFYSDDYINSLVGRGGIEFMTYTMDDEEWKSYCDSLNNQLVY